MPPTTDPQRRARRRGAVIALVCAGSVAAMVGASYAAVPLYRAFCQATGFGGATRRAEAGSAPGEVLDRTITIRFDTNVRGLPWDFAPEQTTQTVRIGAPALAYFKVTNRGSAALTGRASYNVTPDAAGAYFLKTQCFCFNDQTIAAGRTVEFPVIYFVEPKFATDRSTTAFQEITLSYTFFPVAKPKQVAVVR